MTKAPARRRAANGDANRLLWEDRAVHDWYRFVLSFPPHLVRAYLERFGITGGQRVLDPFCGTGTVMVECKSSASPAPASRRTHLLILLTGSPAATAQNIGALGANRSTRRRATHSA